MFFLWRLLQERLCATHSVGDDALADKITDAQAALMAFVAQQPAKTTEDVLYKLALWRWDSSDIAGEITALPPADQVLYSAFRDLVQMTGLRDVLTEEDLAESAFAPGVRNAG